MKALFAEGLKFSFGFGNNPRDSRKGRSHFKDVTDSSLDSLQIDENRCQRL
jgi:hypothetical protein